MIVDGVKKIEQKRVVKRFNTDGSLSDIEFMDIKPNDKFMLVDPDSNEYVTDAYGNIVFTALNYPNNETINIKDIGKFIFYGKTWKELCNRFSIPSSYTDENTNNIVYYTDDELISLLKEFIDNNKQDISRMDLLLLDIKEFLNMFIQFNSIYRDIIVALYNTLKINQDSGEIVLTTTDKIAFLDFFKCIIQFLYV